MDILTEVINRVRLSGTLLFHYELGRPWNVELPQAQDAVFHYLRRGFGHRRTSAGASDAY